jgi:hypothetical protein
MTEKQTELRKWLELLKTKIDIATEILTSGSELPPGFHEFVSATQALDINLYTYNMKELEKEDNFDDLTSKALVNEIAKNKCLTAILDELDLFYHAKGDPDEYVNVEQAVLGVRAKGKQLSDMPQTLAWLRAKTK